MDESFTKQFKELYTSFAGIQYLGFKLKVYRTEGDVLVIDISWKLPAEKVSKITVAKSGYSMIR